KQMAGPRHRHMSRHPEARFGDSPRRTGGQPKSARPISIVSKKAKSATADLVGRRPSRAASRPPHGDGEQERTVSHSNTPIPSTPRAEQKASTTVQNGAVTGDEAGMRVDRFLEARFPSLSFSHIQRVIRKGEVRVDGKRTQPNNRLAAGQTMRIPPLRLDAPAPRTAGNEADERTRAFLKSITLHEDADVLVLNKPMGLAVQGGSGT